MEALSSFFERLGASFIIRRNIVRIHKGRIMEFKNQIKIREQ